MADGMQIVIPSFDDDDDFATTPIPFGRPQNFAFGSNGASPSTSFGASGTATPQNWDNSPSEGGSSFFHARGDSFASETSSTGHAKPSSSLGSKSGVAGHIASPSVANSTFSLPSRKASLASIKNAFKSSKTTASDVPPVPSLDHQSYPALRNPFLRKDSARAVAAQAASSASRRRPSAPSPSPSHHHGGSRSSPPVNPPGAHGRAVSSVAHSGPHRHLQHSPASSLTHSDADHNARNFAATPPPVPRALHRAANSSRIHQPSPSYVSETVTPDNEPNTPAEFALQVILMQFVTCAELRINTLLEETLDYDIPIAENIGPGVDVAFDKNMDSLARIAVKQAKLVIDSVSRWKKSQLEQRIPDTLQQRHLSPNASYGAQMTVRDKLVRRRDIASTYIYCRALIEIIRTIGKDSLDDLFGNSLESTMFSEFVRSPDLQILAPSANQRVNTDLFARLLGHLSRIRFASVTDKFLHELEPLSANQVQKDSDPRIENLVYGLKYLEIKVWPPERFDEGAEFMAILSGHFQNAHGFKLKCTFAETLIHMLHSIGATAQAEVNHPEWGKAIEIIYPKAANMMIKPRYWQFAYPLAITSLCVAPQDYFLKHWTVLCDMTLAKLKERSLRPILLNGLIRLIWTYLYRAQEPLPTTSSRLDGIMRQLFPPGRRALLEDTSEALMYILHFVLCRHFEYGQDLVMELMQEQSTSFDVSSPERTSIAIQAILLSLTSMDAESPPIWPPNSDFNVPLAREDYPISAHSFDSTSLARSNIETLSERCGAILTRLTRICMKSVGNMSVLDAKYKYEISMTVEDAEAVVIRHHGDTTLAYPKSLIPQLDVLRSCFEALPRCLHPSLPISDVLDSLIRDVAHVEPVLADAASSALHRFAAESRFVQLVLRNYGRSLFSPASLARDPNYRIVSEHFPRVKLWVALIKRWVEGKTAEDDDVLVVDPSLPIVQTGNLMDEIEAGGLYLLSSATAAIRACGLAVLRFVPTLRQKYLNPRPESANGFNPHPRTSAPVNIIDILAGTVSAIVLPADESLMITDVEAARLSKWRDVTFTDLYLRLLESDNPLDHSLWGVLAPSLMRICMEKCPAVLDVCRESLNASVMRYHPMISSLSGMSTKAPSSSTPRFPIVPSRSNAPSTFETMTIEQRGDVAQWRLWIIALCACAIPVDSRPLAPRDHTRAPSDPATNRDRLSTARGLFRHLIPFLASEHSLFRDAVVAALGSIHQAVFKTLLEDLQSITSHIYDERGGQKSGLRRPRPQDRLHIAVVRVYALTTRFMKEPRIYQDGATTSLMLRFVRATEMFLGQPEVRGDWEASRLRRYFCTIVEQLFTSLTKDFDRFMPPMMRLTLYRLCEEWCPYGSSPSYRSRYEKMRDAVSSNFRELNDRKQAVDRFQTEAAALAPAAAAAMAALCRGAFYPSNLQSSPTETKPNVEALSVPQLLEWITALLVSDSKPVVQTGRNALLSILSDSERDSRLMDAVARRCYAASSSSPSHHFFDIVATVVINGAINHFDFPQIVWMALVYLGRSDVELRCRAFRMLMATLPGSIPSTETAVLDTALRSTAPTVYIEAQRETARFLARTHPEKAYAILAQCTLRMPQARDGYEAQALHVIQCWISGMVIMSADSILSREGQGALYNLFSLTVRYGETHPDSTQSLWTTLVTGDHVNNGSAVIKFLVEQATIRANSAFITHAKKVVAYVSSTSLGPHVFMDLCSVIEPGAMILAQVPHPTSPASDDDIFIEDLDALLPVPKARQQLAPAEIALLLLSDFMPSDPWSYNEQLPTLVHVVFSLVDHRLASVRTQMRRIFFQIVRCWSAGYGRLGDPGGQTVYDEVIQQIDGLEKEPDVFWSVAPKTNDDPSPKIQRLCTFVVDILQPVYPSIEQHWAEVALQWGNRCPVREPACRSFQVFRALTPTVQPAMIIDMMDRLSNTISDATGTDHKFAKEILLTLISIATSASLPVSLLPQIFWCASACLGTSVEAEFALVIQIMNLVLDSLDCQNASNVEVLRLEKPRNWQGHELCVERLVFSGLRSSFTLDASYTLLGRIASVKGHDVVESSDSRLRLVYTACLPWCLHSIEEGIIDPRLVRLSEEIAALADEEGRSDISHIMVSCSKNRFKRKEDFLRQAISSLRENFWTDFSTDIVTILLGCILNSESWLRQKSLQLLKVLLDGRTPFTLSGSELLMPLLRLLSTDMAAQAMEVLETPMTIIGGPSASHVLRMSVHGLLPSDVEQHATVFGSPEESGWCIANPSEQSSACRHNVAAVVSTCSLPIGQPSRTMSMIMFAADDPDVLHSRIEPDSFIHESRPSSDGASLGDLVNTLHDLNTFFQSDEPPPPLPRIPAPFYAEDAERRVAAILSRSLAKPPSSTQGVNEVDNSNIGWEAPPTPFVDLFSGGYTEADTLHQNFMRMAEESDGEDEARVASPAYTSNTRRTPRGIHTFQSLHGDSDSDEELNSFSFDNPAADQSWSLRRKLSNSRVRHILSPKRPLNAERNRRI